jgi:hypothetical protein
MNIQLLMQMLMGQRGRVPMDEQAPMGIQRGLKIDPGMALPLHMETYPNQPTYHPRQYKLEDLEDLHNQYFTNPRNGVMPRRTRLGIEEGFRSDDLQWLLRSLGNY